MLTAWNLCAQSWYSNSNFIACFYIWNNFIGALKVCNEYPLWLLKFGPIMTIKCVSPAMLSNVNWEYAVEINPDNTEKPSSEYWLYTTLFDENKCIWLPIWERKMVQGILYGFNYGPLASLYRKQVTNIHPSKLWLSSYNNFPSINGKLLLTFNKLNI